METIIIEESEFETEYVQEDIFDEEFQDFDDDTDVSLSDIMFLLSAQAETETETQVDYTSYYDALVSDTRDLTFYGFFVCLLLGWTLLWRVDL